jgi:hypothetical protein
LTPRAGDEYFLAGSDLVRVGDFVKPCKPLIGDIVSLADAEEILPAFHYMVDSGRFLLWREATSWGATVGCEKENGQY